MSIEGYILKGKIAIAQNEYYEAVKAFEEAINLSRSPYPMLLFWCGYAHYLLAEYELSTYKIEQEKRFALSISKLEKARALSLDIEKAKSVSLDEENIENNNTSDLIQILYLLGYLYYRSNDFFSAKERLSECVNLKVSDYTLDQNNQNLKESAKELLNYVWERAIKPTFWRWWWCSPIHKDEKRLLFIIILGLISWGFLSFRLCCPLFHIIYIRLLA